MAEEEVDPVVQLYLDHGMHPPWLRVWHEGVDVTDEPELWPPLWTDPQGTRKGRTRGSTEKRS